MIRLPLITALAFSATMALAQQGQPGLHFIENWDLDSDGQVTLSEATERRESVFLSFDADANGVLEGAEYDLFDEARANDMAENGGHGQGALKRAAEGMARAFNDTDGDGTVSRAEFLGHTATWLGMMDRNGDGVISTADFGRG